MKNGNEGLENLKEIERLKKRVYEVEGELSIIKGIGNNSPEMIALKKSNQQKDDRIRELEQINKEHQDLNGKLREEMKSIELGTVNNFRRKGVL